MKSSKKLFTLVELIIVIAIIAILAVTAFLLLTKWLSKARDSSRASNLANIENSLQISLTDKSSLPKPDSYTLIYASGTSNVIGYQGYFGEGVKDAVGNINSAPKDGDDYFTYYLNADLNKYQLAGFMENEIAYNPNVVSAVDYSSRYVNVRGEKLGLLTDSNKSPLQTLGLTGLNILSGDRTYIAYYDNNTNLSLSGQSFITMLSLGNKNSAQYDTGLVFYSDMETTIVSGGLTVLKDFSKYGNNGTCYNSSSFPRTVGSGINCFNGNGPTLINGRQGKAMLFDGIDDFVNISTGNITQTSGFTISLRTNPLDQYLGTYSYHNDIIRTDWFSISTHDKFQTTPYFFINHYRLDGNSDTQWETGLNISLLQNSYSMITFSMDRKTSTLKVFFNGNLVENKQFIILAYKNTINRLAIANGAAGNYHGSVDEVRIYNRVLSDDEVKALYNATN